MSDDKGMQGALSSFTGSIRDTSSAPPDTAEETLLQEMDDFFSLGKNTERVRRFIEDNDDALSLVASEAADDTDSPEGLRLYAVFQKYAALIDGIVEDFVATKSDKRSVVLASLVAVIQKEWNFSDNAYRLLCTSYIAASLDYKAFLQFADDLYGTTHYSMAADDESYDAGTSSSSSRSSSGGDNDYDYDDKGEE